MDSTLVSKQLAEIQLQSPTGDVSPQQTCPKCAAESGTTHHEESPERVYALGRIELRFPRLSVEKELLQVLAREDSAGLTDHQAVHCALAKRENRYLARQMCWLFNVAGIPTYLLYPYDLADLELLVEAARPRPRPTDIDLVIGMRGGLAAPEACNGMQVPIVIFHQLYSFDLDGLMKTIPVAEGVPEEGFRRSAEEVFLRLMQMTDNAGATDAHRAINYLAVRYDRIYSLAAEQHSCDHSLSAIEVRRSPVSGTRNVQEVIFSFTNRKTDVVEKFFVRVDVTESFPFLVTKLSPYYDRT